ncbi:MAG: hypothetical protein ACYDIC_05590 [Desulfobaccales bacterium]
MPSKQNVSIALPDPDATTKSESISKEQGHIACRYVEILSDPPGAYVYYQDGNYWGQTQEGVPVELVFHKSVYWNEQNKIWYLANGDPVYQWVTFTLKKRGYRSTSQTFQIGPYHTRLSSPEELISQGLLGKCPDKYPENTTKMMVVLDTGTE